MRSSQMRSDHDDDDHDHVVIVFVVRYLRICCLYILLINLSQMLN